MKFILSFITAVSLSLICEAQNNTFPVDNATWTNNFRNYYFDNDGSQIFTSIQYSKYCIEGIDTIINSITYTEVNFCTALNATYHGAIREDVGQVFFVPADSTSEFLLYDFSANVGQNVDVIIQSHTDPLQGVEFTIQSTLIDEIDTITVNNQPRRRLHVGGYSWIEGIGSTTGLFMDPHYYLSGYSLDLVCMSASNITIYSIEDGHLEQGIPGNCDLTLDVITYDFSDDLSKFFPNPTRGSLTLSEHGEQPIKYIQVVNSFGKVISTHYPLISDFENMQINGAAGIYYVIINRENGERSAQKIIKL